MLLAVPTRPRGRAALWLSAAAVSAALVLGGSLAGPTVAYAADTAQLVQLAPSSALVNGDFVTSVTTFAASGAANTTTTGFNRHATLSGLAENTQYSYRVGSEGNWSTTYSFKTQSFEGDFDFLFFGDPQIG